MFEAICISILSFFGGTQANLDLLETDIGEMPMSFDIGICPDAGPDTLICGFDYELQGSEEFGFWTVLCHKSIGKVLFSQSFEDTTSVKVDQCGEYAFVYEVLTGPCIGKDTVVIQFEDPSSTKFDYKLEIMLDLEAECHVTSASVSCDNVISIPGADEPDLDWEFCAFSECQFTEYTVEAIPSPDSCLAQQMICDTSTVSNSDMACVSLGVVNGDNILDIAGDLINSVGVICPLPMPCYPIPPECFDTIYVTSELYVPILDGGQWNYFDDNGDLQPLNDTTIVTIDGRPYAFIVEPGSDYYGPDDLKFTLWQFNSGSTWIKPTIHVDISIQWVMHSYFDTVEVITPVVILKDSCMVIPCGGVSVDPATVDIPALPDYPCGPVDLSFGVGPGEMYYVVELNCDTPQDFIETCPGQVEVFDISGFYNFPCLSVEGCPFDVIVDVFENFATPTIGNIVTTCSSDFLSYSVSFDVVGGSGQYLINGVGSATEGQVIDVNNIAECTDYFIEVTDLSSSCSIQEVVVMCCECPTSIGFTNLDMCDGEVYDFHGQFLSTSGVYEATLVNSQGCDSTLTLTLTVYSTSNDTIYKSICEGDVYDFYGQSLQLSGIYSESILNTQGCEDIMNVVLDVNAPDYEYLSVTMCEGDSYDFLGDMLLVPGNYSMTLQNQYNCDSLIELDLEMNSIDFELSSEPDCVEGETGQIIVSDMIGEGAPFLFSLDDIDFGPSILFENLQAAEYTVYMIDSDGCTTSRMIEVREIPALSISLEDEYVLCGNSTFEVDLLSNISTSQNVSILWDDGTDLTSRIITEAGEYWVELSNDCELLRKDFRIEYEESVLDQLIFVPNVFTPNGDGVNDEFKVYVGAPIIEFEMHVYDRWGDILIEWYDTEESWNGNFLGQDMNPAVYVWWLKAKVEGCDGTIGEVLLKGDVTLLR